MTTTEQALQRQITMLERRVTDLERQDPGPFGTWTPAFAGSTGAGTITYSSQVGHYARIGQVCHIQAYLVVSAISVAPTGLLRVTGLPFTALNSSFSSLAVGGCNLNLDAGYTQHGLIAEPNTAYLRVMEMGDSVVTDFPAASLGTISLLLGGTYLVES